MKNTDLNRNWDVTVGEITYQCDIPHDVTALAARDHSCAMGELNGYHPTECAAFTHSLPTIKSGKAELVLSGVCGYGDVYVNDEPVGCVHGYSPTVFDLTGKLTGARNTLTIKLVSAPGMSDKYMGLGVAGGATLVTVADTDIERGSLFVTTNVVGDKTYADATVTVKNNGEAQKLVLVCEAFNARGKRAGKKQRKIYMRAGAVKEFTVRVRIAKPYEWTVSDPYMYTMTASIGEELDAECRFGIVTRQLNSMRGLYLNGKIIPLRGAYISHADAAIGGVSNYSNEVRRLSALKSLGYNAVHLVECPTQATLDALDDVGMYAYVDLYSCLTTGKAPLDSHLFFKPDVAEISEYVTNAVTAMRNHPGVVIYGVADDVPECYGRSYGYETIRMVADAIKSVDYTRPVTVSAREFVPTLRELEEIGIRRHFESDAAMVNAGRERDIFSNLTQKAFDAVDICGLNYLHPLYSTEKTRGNRLILGARTSADKAFESLDETDKNPRVIGDFAECGIDYPGGGGLNTISCSLGDLDSILDVKPQGVHKSLMLGARNFAYIVVLDPDTDEPVPMWNWPRYLGQTVTVQVYTSGDVVALYLDGRLIGRKLAGKVNRHIATFAVDYYPGTLEAVGYYKGSECARVALKSAGSPKTVKLSAQEKNLVLSRGDLGFVHIDVCDRDGNLVPYAMRTLTASVTGGEIVGFINGDPLLRKSELDSCPAFGGHALCVIKPDPSEDRAVVKISGDGLLSAKLTFKIKD